ncbi:hypothetical protein AH06_144 [Erwinia phage AH06]|nr:hypothetical protein AH06_144 [Erwinia phage AH06]
MSFLKSLFKTTPVAALSVIEAEPKARTELLARIAHREANNARTIRMREIIR